MIDSDDVTEIYIFVNVCDHLLIDILSAQNPTRLIGYFFSIYSGHHWPPLIFPAILMRQASTNK